MKEPTVWVQVGGTGLRTSEDDGLATAAELMAHPGHSRDVAAIHTGDCNIATGLMEGGGTCDCDPLFVGRGPIS